MHPIACPRVLTVTFPSLGRVICLPEILTDLELLLMKCLELYLYSAYISDAYASLPCTQTKHQPKI